jgi:hypothetical protein
VRAESAGPLYTEDEERVAAPRKSLGHG